MEVRGKPAATERTGKTLVIPPKVQSAIFNYCEGVIGEADALLDARDAGKIAPLDDAMLRIRDAGLYLLSISTGMRNSEATGLENDSWRMEEVRGVTYHWVRTVEHKTGKGLVEYLAPPETLSVLRIVQRYAKPLQERLALEINRRLLEAERRGPDSRECLQRLHRVQKSAKKLFLGANMHGGDDGSGAGGRIDVLTEMGCGLALDRLARAAGTNWNLTSHQCRRTYARMFVESKMGRASLIFLKWQLKHSSMSMTQLYAANPLQDTGLYGEFIDEMSCLKVEIMESWLSDAPLSGGAGRKITELRAIPIADRASLLKHTADSVHIRPTGHAWCLAQEKGCGGAGLYEATRCVDCKNGVIDESFASVWQGIHAQQLELLELDDVGPAVQQRAQREARLSRKVLEELGVTPLAPHGLASPNTGEETR
jgi:integrase